MVSFEIMVSFETKRKKKEKFQWNEILPPFKVKVNSKLQLPSQGVAKRIYHLSIAYV